VKTAAKVLVSTAYLPPAEYFSLLKKSDEILIEREENYLKQSYRNRCYILSAHGPQTLTVPVYLGSLHKTPVKDIRIDYTKRWQKVHLGAIMASYNSSPYFQFYFDDIEKIISGNYEFLIDLNMKLTELFMEMLQIKIKPTYSLQFEPTVNNDYDYRYRLSPKKISEYRVKEYLQVFSGSNGFVQGLSVLDLIFNTGPEASSYL
jgi:hypothetical protein